jgi:O-acetyl-ADP-ribose deacetylase
MRITVVQGDLTKQSVDAIVNAANSALTGGGGVDGAIHRAAGRELLEACLAIPANAQGERCPVGEARITPAGRLPAGFVIHTVGPVYYRHPDPPRALASAFRSSLQLAVDHGLKTIAFPAISCGVYGYPMDEAAAVAIAVAREQAWDLDEIRFVLLGEDSAEVFRRALA